jgi:hypothetical protein
MLTYKLFKIQSMLLSVTNRKASHMLNYQLFKIHSMHLSAANGKASQRLTYQLFKTQSMLLSATSRKCQPDADLHPVQNPKHAPVINKKGRPARC